MYEARASQTVGQRLSQTNLLSIFSTQKVSTAGVIDIPFYKSDLDKY